MILFQAGFVGLTGLGLGIGPVRAHDLRGETLSSRPTPPSSATPTSALAFAMVLVIATISSYAGIRKVLTIDPFDIFRG